MSSPSLSLHSLELYNQLSVLKIVNFNNLLFVTEFSFARTVEKTTAAGPEYGGIRYGHSVYFR